MLNKSACAHCRRKHAMSGWTPWDDVIWDLKGEVRCFFLQRKAYIVQVKGTPPERCPYALAHALGAAHVE